LITTAKARVRQALRRVLPTLDELAYGQKFAACLARGGLSRAARDLDPNDTTSWEFSAFSQNGEDGLIEQLVGRVRNPNRYFVEIGASDGLENNSSYLAFVRKYCGVMLDGDAVLVNRARHHLQAKNWGVKFLALRIEPNNIPTLLGECLELRPDFFSLDVDGVDLYIAEALLESGFRPRVVCVEYNSAFGPEAAVTIPYAAGFDYHKAHGSGLYYGASVQGWIRLMSRYGYEFVTVDVNGINAFFIDPAAVDFDAAGLRRLTFAENFAQRTRLRGDWRSQSALIEDLPRVDVNS
jgi:hypothetical protein